MAFTGGDSSSGDNVHTMQDGSTLTGPMTDIGGTHTMDDRSMMDDMGMEP